MGEDKGEGENAYASSKGALLTLPSVPSHPKEVSIKYLKPLEENELPCDPDHRRMELWISFTVNKRLHILT